MLVMFSICMNCCLFGLFFHETLLIYSRSYYYVVYIFLTLESKVQQQSNPSTAAWDTQFICDKIIFIWRFNVLQLFRGILPLTYLKLQVQQV